MTEIVIGGKTFNQVVNGSFAHDMWIMKRIREAGLSQIVMIEGETEDDFIERIAVVAYQSGAALDLMGGLCLPQGVEPSQWTPEIAETVSKFFGEVCDPEDKAKLRSIMAGLLFHFFVKGVESSKTSQRFGTPAATENPQGIVEPSTTEISAS